MKKPFAYISAAWSGREFEDSDQAAVYCRKVYEAGFTPICPLLYLPHFLNDSVPAEHKDGIDMGRELLRRSHVLIVCGDTVDEKCKKRHCGGPASEHHGHNTGRHPEDQEPGPCGRPLSGPAGSC